MTQGLVLDTVIPPRARSRPEPRQPERALPPGRARADRCLRWSSADLHLPRRPRRVGGQRCVLRHGRRHDRPARAGRLPRRLRRPAPRPHPGRPLTPRRRSNRCCGEKLVTITAVDPHTALVLIDLPTRDPGGTYPAVCLRGSSSSARSAWPRGSASTTCRSCSSASPLEPDGADAVPGRTEVPSDRPNRPEGWDPHRRGAHRTRRRHCRDQAQLRRLPRDRPRRPAAPSRSDPDRPR